MASSWFKFKYDAYTPYALSQHTEKELRKEYSRMRDTAQKRLKRLKAGGFDTTAVYKLNVNRYKKLKNIGSKKDLISRMSDMYRFLSSEASKLGGMHKIEEHRIKELHEGGYTWVNQTNIKEFGTFMNFIKALYPYHPSADAETARDLLEGYREVRQEAKNPEQMQKLFEAWMEKNTPDVYLLKPSFREIPAELQIPDPWS